jgi:hypothetical protein
MYVKPVGCEDGSWLEEGWIEEKIDDLNVGNADGWDDG